MSFRMSNPPWKVAPHHNGLAPGVFRNRPACPTNRRDRLACPACFVARHFDFAVVKERSHPNGKDLAFNVAFAVPGDGRKWRIARIAVSS
jgi:hypothetical protein